MEQNRKRRAAKARRRRRTWARMLRLVMSITACTALVVLTTWMIQTQMANCVSAPGHELVMPTQLPQGTLTPAHDGYVTVTAAPTAIPKLTAEELNAGDGWMLMLVNAENELPEGYAPPELTVLSNGESVDKRMYPQLQSMFDDARAQKIYPFVRSGYRTQEEQQATMDEKIAEYVEAGMTQDEARAEAELYVARPGTSEHETGLAVDINADTDLSEREDVYEWLAENCADYGFILRYPEDKTEITGIGYEPWHFRYVGVEAATEIMEGGLCLEEYLGAAS